MARAGYVLAPLLALVVAGCGATPVRPQASPSTAVRGLETVDEDAFWQIVGDAREQASDDPDAMAEVLEERFADAGDDELRGFQRQLVAASRRLYTWRHAAAADMVCGSVGDDGFTDWRSWVITLGRETFERIAADPDNLADVEDLTAGCAGAGELFGAAVSGIYYERHGYDDDTFPVLEPGGTSPTGTPPSGYPRNGTEPLRATLPRLAERT
ncbi:DUF4240 domain-containing protein [Paractinoplanes durhamensis]|nr:DUF4240 domain-containing protein [Actinoplanes durhamensis]